MILIIAKIFEDLTYVSFFLRLLHAISHPYNILLLASILKITKSELKGYTMANMNGSVFENIFKCTILISIWHQPYNS